MATKPTKRILDWASGGTVTDPGAGKEAAGWATSDRPPAQWWNWILQSFGDWLTYFEDTTDDLIPVAPLSVIQVTTNDTTGVPTVSTKAGIAPTGTHSQESNGQGDTGGEVHIDYGAAVTSISAVQITSIWDSSNNDMRAFPMLIGVTGSTQIEFVAITAADVFVDFDDVNPQDFVLTVWGVA